MILEPQKTALVCIEFQNDFTSPGGVLHDAVKGVMDSTSMLEKTAKAAAAARAHGAKVLHVPITFTDDYRELPKEPYGILAGVKNGGAFKQSGWGGQICEAMTPAADDIIVDGKRGLCGFATTNLDFILRQNKIENVVLAGFLTNCCVESTMRAAYEKGFNVFTLKDCCAATSEEEHAAAVKYTFPMFSTPIDQEGFLRRLGDSN